MIPAGSMPAPAARHLVAQQLERLAHPGLDDLAHLEPADRPAGVLAEDRDADLLVLVDAAQVARPVLDLELLGDLEARLEPDRDVVGDVVAADRQDRACGTASRRRTARGRSCPAPMSATATPSSFSVSDRTASADGERVDDELVDLDPGRGDALGQVLDRGRRRRDDVGLDLEPERAHPERVLDALLAVDREAARRDVEDVAVRRDRDRPGDLDRPVDVLAGDLAVVAADRDLAARVQALDVLAADADEGAVDLPARTAARRCSTASAIEWTVWSMLTTTPFFSPDAGTVPWPMIVSRPSRLDLADEGADLARADVDADQDRFSFHRSVTSPSLVRSRGSGAG